MAYSQVVWIGLQPYSIQFSDTLGDRQVGYAGVVKHNITQASL